MTVWAVTIGAVAIGVLCLGAWLWWVVGRHRLKRVTQAELERQLDMLLAEGHEGGRVSVFLRGIGASPFFEKRDSMLVLSVGCTSGLVARFGELRRMYIEAGYPTEAKVVDGPGVEEVLEVQAGQNGKEAIEPLNLLAESHLGLREFRMDLVRTWKMEQEAVNRQARRRVD